jgi:hypothetical protein
MAELMPMTSPRELMSGPPLLPKVDGGVGLDVVVEARVEELAADEADHADGDRVDVAERVADGADPLAHPQFVGVAERHRLQILGPVDLQERHVDGGIGADDLGAERRVRRPGSR